MNNNYYVNSDIELTEWYNPTKYTAKFRLLSDKMGMVSDPETHKQYKAAQIFINVEIPPGGKKTLESKYDQAIQTLDYTKTRIVGGHCPWLKKLNSQSLPLADYLDFEKIAAKEKLEKMAEILRFENSMNEAMNLLKNKREEDELPLMPEEEPQLQVMEVEKPAPKKRGRKPAPELLNKG